MGRVHTHVNLHYGGMARSLEEGGWDRCCLFFPPVSALGIEMLQRGPAGLHLFWLSCAPAGTAASHSLACPQVPAVVLTSGSSGQQVVSEVPLPELLPALGLAHAGGCYGPVRDGPTPILAFASRCCTPTQPSPLPVPALAGECSSLARPGPPPALTWTGGCCGPTSPEIITV